MDASKKIIERNNKVNSKINKMMIALLMVPVMAFGMTMFVPSMALAKTCDNGTTVADGADCAQGTDTPTQLFGEGGVFTNIINAALFLIGAIAVLMLIYGGIRYTISGGDSKAVTDAKNTIMYAIVGIVVALMAYAIVNLVIGQLVK
jgi:vacuolar-type H+-ATPase subunit I/STV1